MPVYRYRFDVTADNDGNFRFPQNGSPNTFSPPTDVTVISLAIETKSGCEGRVHPTVAHIEQVGVPDDSVDIKMDLPDCRSREMRVDLGMDAGATYTLQAQATGFEKQERVIGEIRVRYRLGSVSLATRIGWERQYQAEEALKTELLKIQGRHTDRDKVPGEERCYPNGPRNKHGKREHRYVEINPDYGSVKIWVDWANSRARGETRIGFRGYMNEKQYHKCTGQIYSYTFEARGRIDLEMNIRVNSGRVSVKISAQVTIEEYWGAPQWGGAHDLIRDLIRDQVQNRINKEISKYERTIEDKINNSRSSTLKIEASSALEFLEVEQLRHDRSAFELLVEDYLMGSSFSLAAYDELNPDYIASALNNRSFALAPVAEVDLGYGLWLRDFRITLKTEDAAGVGSISPGDVRVILSPHIRVALRSAIIFFYFESATNIFAGGRLNGSGAVSLTLSHVYEQPKIDFNTIQIDELYIEQVGDDLTRFLKDKLNDKLPEQVRRDDALLQAIASVLNEKISDVIRRSGRNSRLLTCDEFLEQYDIARDVY